MPSDDFLSVASLLLPLMIRLHLPSVNVSSSFFEVNGRRKEQPTFSILQVFLPDVIAYRTKTNDHVRVGDVLTARESLFPKDKRKFFVDWFFQR